MKSSLKVYTALVGLCAVALAFFFAQQQEMLPWLQTLALMGLTVAIENFAFELPMLGSVSLGFATIFAGLLFGGPPTAILCALASSITIQEAREKKPMLMRAFNVGQLTLSAGLSSLVYLQLGGDVISAANPLELAPTALAAVTFYMVNVSLVALFISLLRERSFAEVIQGQGFISYGAGLLVLALLGAIVAYLLALKSWSGLLLLSLPFIAARQTFRVYAELSEAYLSTVRSLVETIEAKDPYTRGHSERVSQYALEIGGHLGLSSAELNTLERAALLHDVGKLGVQVETLTSPDELTAEEVQAIRRHPALGSELVSHVDFLADIVPVIRYHHERFDGAGYPEGLMGDRIPLLSRVLAVADTYDAMTSDRAYRPGMPKDTAWREIERVAGAQLDPSICAAFLAMVRDQGVGEVEPA